MQPVEAEHHYTITEIARLWHLAPATVRNLFAGVPGVLRVVRPETRNKRRFVSIRIPARVMRAVHQQLTAKNGSPK
jgi:hypothetical protein